MLIRFLGVGSAKGTSSCPVKRDQILVLNPSGELTRCGISVTPRRKYAMASIYMENPHHNPELDISKATQHTDLHPLQKDIITDPYSTCVPG